MEALKHTQAVAALPSPPSHGWASVFMALLGKELLLGWRQRTRLGATAFFGILVLLMFSFAVGPQHAVLAKIAPGFFWLALYFASVLQLAAASQAEMENDCLEGLRLLSVPPVQLFLAKALLNTAVLVALGLLLLPLAMALYGVSMAGSFGWFLLLLLLGCGAISAPGTLYGTITTQARSRDILLPLLLLPLVVPSLMAAVKATGLLFAGDPMGQQGSWLLLLLAANGIFWPLSALLYGRVIEE